MKSLFESNPILFLAIVYILIGFVVSVIRMFIYYVNGEDFSPSSDDEATAFCAVMVWPANILFAIIALICILARKLSGFYLQRGKK